MIEIINYLVDHATDLLKMGGPIMGMLLIFLESVFPVLPLGAFITLNMNAFGFIVGFVISWIATCIGCYASYFVFSSFLSKYFYQLLSRKDARKIHKNMEKIRKMPLGNLTVLIALPFTPAFLINIASGLAKVDRRKFLFSILIGKVFIVYFWGFIGTSFLESMTDITTIITIGIMLVVAYFVSKYVSKKANIK